MAANADPESIINEPDRGFLGDIFFHPALSYRGRQQFLVDYEAELQRHRSDTSGHASEWFLPTGIDNYVFTSEFLDPVDQNTPWTSWSSYDAHLQLLLIRLTKSSAHETASLTFHNMFLEAVELIGLKYSLKEIGSATHFASLGAKEPDQAWRPHQLPPGRLQDWPSVVMGIAFSETEAKLGSDVRSWTRESAGNVKVVLTLRINRQQPKIKIEKWVTDKNNNNWHHLDQSITISKADNNRIVLSNAPLIINFEELFLRPASIPREKNIEVDAEKLQYLAMEIGDEQGF